MNIHRRVPKAAAIEFDGCHSLAFAMTYRRAVADECDAGRSAPAICQAIAEAFESNCASSSSAEANREIASFAISRSMSGC